MYSHSVWERDYNLRFLEMARPLCLRSVSVLHRRHWPLVTSPVATGHYCSSDLLLRRGTASQPDSCRRSTSTSSAREDGEAEGEAGAADERASETLRPGVAFGRAARPHPSIDRMIRVNQAGEFAANRICAGQAAVLGSTETGPLIQVGHKFS